MSGTEFSHQPVMVTEIVELFSEVPAGTVVDATVGGGGHARALLDAHPHLRLVGLDQDPDAVDAARQRLAGLDDRVTLARTRFDRLAETVHGLGLDTLSGVLFDLGVSSPQLDRPDRGFSYRADAPLDMRMDPDGPVTAADIVNGWPEADLARLLRDLGDERFAGRIAAAIVAARPGRRHGRLGRAGPRRHPGAGPPPGRPPGQAHLPGPAHRGQRRARGAAARPRHRPRPARARRALRRARLPLGRGPHREGALPRPRPPAAAPARPGCRASAARCRPSACSSGGPGSRRRPRWPPTPGPRAPASGPSRSCRPRTADPGRGMTPVPARAPAPRPPAPSRPASPAPRRPDRRRRPRPAGRSEARPVPLEVVDAATVAGRRRPGPAAAAGHLDRGGRGLRR